MKKKILIILGIWILISGLFALLYPKMNPQKKKLNETEIISSGAKLAKEPLKSIGKAAAEVALKNENANLKPFAEQMQKYGATEIKIIIETNKSRFEKSLPTVIIGGKEYKNKTKCSIVTYEYENEKYEVGVCK
mgnify:CR=1 FL=1